MIRTKNELKTQDDVSWPNGISTAVGLLDFREANLYIQPRLVCYDLSSVEDQSRGDVPVSFFIKSPEEAYLLTMG